jgi:hypothetical protein
MASENKSTQKKRTKRVVKGKAKPNATAKVTTKGTKVGGSKLSRSEVVQVRLDPKLRFGAEIAARKQRRTLSSFIEWAIAETVYKVEVGPDEGQTAFFVMNDIWDPNEFDRFANLVEYYPHFLSYDEELLWERICALEYLWTEPSELEAGLSLTEHYPKARNVPRRFFEEIKKCIKGDLSTRDLQKLIDDPDSINYRS